MGPFTLICSDLDGTLLDDNRRISAYSRQVIARARVEGAVFCLASGRPPAMMGAYHVFLELDTPMVANNGALVLVPGAGVLLCRPIPRLPALAFLGFCDAHGLDWAIFAQDAIYLRDSPKRLERYREYNALAREQGAPPVQVRKISTQAQISQALTQGCLRISLVFRSVREEALLQEYFSQPRGLAHVHSTPESYDILAPGVDKWNGILAVCRHYGIPRERVCVFGNDINDIEMVVQAGTAFVVSNAERPLLECAPTVIESNREDGVARAIERYVLGHIQPLPQTKSYRGGSHE